MIKNISKAAKKLATQKIMPNLKFGTITSNLKDTISKVLKNRIFLSNDKFGSFGCNIGSASLSDANLIENFDSTMLLINAIKPQKTKGKMIKKICLETSMGPAFEIEL